MYSIVVGIRNNIPFHSEVVYCTMHLVTLMGIDLHRDEQNTAIITTVQNAIGYLPEKKYFSYVNFSPIWGT